MEPTVNLNIFPIFDRSHLELFREELLDPLFILNDHQGQGITYQELVSSLPDMENWPLSRILQTTERLSGYPWNAFLSPDTGSAQAWHYLYDLIYGSNPRGLVYYYYALYLAFLTQSVEVLSWAWNPIRSRPDDLHLESQIDMAALYGSLEQLLYVLHHYFYQPEYYPHLIGYVGVERIEELVAYNPDIGEMVPALRSYLDFVDRVMGLDFYFTGLDDEGQIIPLESVVDYVSTPEEFYQNTERDLERLIALMDTYSISLPDIHPVEIEIIEYYVPQIYLQ
jgi:hypothetical protein